MSWEGLSQLHLIEIQKWARNLNNMCVQLGHVCVWMERGVQGYRGHEHFSMRQPLSSTGQLAETMHHMHLWNKPAHAHSGGGVLGLLVTATSNTVLDINMPVDLLLQKIAPLSLLAQP